LFWTPKGRIETKDAENYRRLKSFTAVPRGRYPRPTSDYRFLDDETTGEREEMTTQRNDKNSTTEKKKPKEQKKAGEHIMIH